MPGAESGAASVRGDLDRHPRGAERLVGALHGGGAACSGGAAGRSRGVAGHGVQLRDGGCPQADPDRGASGSWGVPGGDVVTDWQHASAVGGPTNEYVTDDTYCQSPTPHLPWSSGAANRAERCCRGASANQRPRSRTTNLEPRKGAPVASHSALDITSGSRDADSSRLISVCFVAASNGASTSGGDTCARIAVMRSMTNGGGASAS